MSHTFCLGGFVADGGSVVLGRASFARFVLVALGDRRVDGDEAARLWSAWLGVAVLNSSIMDAMICGGQLRSITCPLYP